MQLVHSRLIDALGLDADCQEAVHATVYMKFGTIKLIWSGIGHCWTSANGANGANSAQVGGIAEQSTGALGAMAGWLVVRARCRGAGVLVTLTDQASSFRASPSIPPPSMLVIVIILIQQ